MKKKFYDISRILKHGEDYTFIITPDNQIREMAKAIDNSHWRIEQDLTGCHINSNTMARYLYNAGYRKQSEWVNVSVRVPENGDRVLVYVQAYHINYMQVGVDRFVEGKWERMGPYVTHWMPLPEPPNGE